MEIKFSPPDIGAREIEEVGKVLRSGWLTTGPETRLFEEKLSVYCGTERTVCLNSATAALELTLRVLGIGPGDEVITSAYTYTASASVILHVGARPVLVDTQRGSYEMDYAALERAINEKTKAVIAVELGGVICDYERIYAAAEAKRGVFVAAGARQSALGRIAVISDAAHALGSERGGKKCGQIADYTCFSFHAVKNLTTGEGGAVTWKSYGEEEDGKLYKEYQLLSLHGQSKDALAKTQLGAWEYDVVGAYYKCNMTDIMAAIGVAQLARYEQMLARRRELIGIYDRALEGAAVEVMAHAGRDWISSGHLYLVRLKGKSEEERNEVIRQMAGAGVATNVHYKPLPMHSAYKAQGYRMEEYPNAYRQYENEITLPLYSTLGDEEAGYVASQLKRALGGE